MLIPGGLVALRRDPATSALPRPWAERAGTISGIIISLARWLARTAGQHGVLGNNEKAVYVPIKTIYRGLLEM